MVKRGAAIPRLDLVPKPMPIVGDLDDKMWSPVIMRQDSHAQSNVEERS